MVGTLVSDFVCFGIDLIYREREREREGSGVVALTGIDPGGF